MRMLTMAITLVMVLGSTAGFAMGAIITNGDMSDTSSLTWTISSGAIDGVLVPGERQATTTYGDSTYATGGTSRFMKTFSLDTRGMSQNQYNVNSLKMFSFDGTGTGGSAVSSEQIGVETMGMPGPNDTWSAYHNTVNAGSSVAIQQGSLVTEAQARTVGAYPGGVPVALNYGINLQGLDDEPAVGSAGAFMNAHLQQGRGNSTEPSSDVIFSQQSSARGSIFRFAKTVSYTSG